MSQSKRRNPLDRVIIDLNTQCDLLLPKGALPVSNRNAILPNIRKLMNWARLRQVSILSTLESRRAGECSRGMPPYCLDRTPGQRKVPFTLMPRRIVFFGDNTLDMPLDVFRRYQQVIFTKRTPDFLSNPKADRLVQSFSPNHYIVFGVVTEHCVKAAVLAMLARNHRVAVVTDACGFWSAADADLAMRQMDAKGAVLVKADELIAGLADERIRASRPSIHAEDDAETDAGTAVLSDGAHRGNGKNVPANGRHLKVPLHLVARAGARRSASPVSKGATRSDPRLRKRRGGLSQPRPPAGLA